MSYNEEIKKRRIHTFPYDTILNVNLAQDVDFLEILSLKINQKDLYKLHTSNYGMLVGRVLANDSFGIPNCKVSIFIAIDDNDKKNIEISNFYPYTNVNSTDDNGIRYNLLPDENTSDECYAVVGTFPNKRLMLDNDTVLEIFDKYWKYTTVTNECGDYFIASIPVGNCTVHIDFDISDIGILSQRPRDMIYKGYNITQFENANQFKQSTNLNNLSQLYSQNQVVYVYPFCGEDDLNNIAITRCDIQVQYKFEPTCVFLGSIITDTYSTAIGHNCKPFRTSGYNRSLIAGEGTIEMIRKTAEGLTEEFQIQGNRLIDGDGVWCYQIPMNLDYVKMDEFGNIVPTDDPSKGIPTRTRVRFRLTMQESENDGISRHRAKYLIPNNPTLTNNKNVVLDKTNDKTLEGYYEFGSATDDESYRDLFWNNVYSVKNYIPRLQVSKKASSQNYTGIRTVNYSDAKNPAPFNKIRFRLTFAYRLSCIIATIVLLVIGFINKIIIGAWNWFFDKLCKIGKIPLIGALFKWACNVMKECIEFPFISDTDEGDCEVKCYFPGCDSNASKKATKKENPDCDSIEDEEDTMKEKLEQLLAEENEAVNLDFYNDWLNGSLYLPLWYWKKRRKKTFFFGLFSRKAINAFCNCDNIKTKLHLFFPCTFQYNTSDFSILNLNDKNNKDRWHDKAVNYFNIKHGIIKEKTLSNGLQAYYYSCGVEQNNSNFIRLFATDIILLGSLNSCDINGVPQLFKNLPSTTSNIMPVNRDVEQPCNTDDDAYIIQEVTGMDFFTSSDLTSDATYGNGYFMNIGCSTVVTLPKTCVNVERLSELGVSLDMSYTDVSPSANALSEVSSLADGMVTRFEIEDNESRSMFATLNHNGLQKLRYSDNLGYYFYDFHYLYPIDFDGRMNSYSSNYTSKLPTKTYDYKNRSYLLFRQGDNIHFYNDKFPLYNNSFYFYFGLNEGNTAIDKFNKLYFSQCFKDKKYPFSLKVISEPSAWMPILSSCQYDKEKLGYIKIVLENIAIPYYYSIEDSLGKKIVNNRSETSLILEFNKYFPNNIAITNGIYTFTFTDANGETLTQIINLAQQPIFIEYETTNLTKRYFADSLKEDFCGKFNGNFILTELSIDNQIKMIDSIKQINSNTFEVNLIGESDVYVLLTINSLESENDYICNVQLNDNNQWSIGIWKPGKYEVKVEQKIYGLNENCSLYEPNTSVDIFQIFNGKSFDMKVNGILLRFILGKNYDNDNFAVKNGSDVESYNKVDTSWLQSYNPDIYAFNEFLESGNDTVIGNSIKKNLEYWEDAIDINSDGIAANDEDAITEAIYLTKSYQLQTVVNMMKGSYLTSLTPNEVNIGHIGGVSPVIYKSYTIPSETIEVIDNREDVVMSNSSVTINIPNYEFGSEAGYVFNVDLPFYIGNNYTLYRNNHWEKNNVGFNPIFQEKIHQDPWAYFAIFDNNGNGSYKCPPYVESYTSNNIQKYFRILSIDKRLDFDIPLLISCISNNDVIANFTWAKGYANLNIINGVAFSYVVEDDSPYIYNNGIKDKYEYYDDNGFIKHNNDAIPYYFDATINGHKLNSNEVSYQKLPSELEDVMLMDDRRNYPTCDVYLTHDLYKKQTFDFHIISCSYDISINENMPELKAYFVSGDEIDCKIQILNNIICFNVTTTFMHNKIKWNYFRCMPDFLSISSITLLPDVNNINDYLMVSEIPKVIKLTGNEDEQKLVRAYEQGQKVAVKTLSSGVTVGESYLYYNNDYLYDNNVAKYTTTVFDVDNLNIRDTNYISVVLLRKFLPNHFLSKTATIYNVANTFDVRGFDLILVDILSYEDNTCSVIFELLFPSINDNQSLINISGISIIYENKTYNGTLYQTILFSDKNTEVAKQYKFDKMPNQILNSEVNIDVKLNFTLFTILVNNIVLEPLL